MVVFHKFKVQTDYGDLILVKLTSPGEEPLYEFLMMYYGYKHSQSLEPLPFSGVDQS